VVAAFLETVDVAPVEAMASLVVAAVSVAVGAEGEMRGVVAIAATGVAATRIRMPRSLIINRYILGRQPVPIFVGVGAVPVQGDQSSHVRLTTLVAAHSHD